MSKLGFFIPLILAGFSGGGPAQALPAMISPSGKVTVELTFGSDQRPLYAVKFEGQSVTEPSHIGFKFYRGLAWGSMRLVKTSTRSVDQTYRLPLGKARTARDHFNEWIFELSETAPPSRKLNLEFRVYDDGVGFRYRVPSQAGLSRVVIEEEETTFGFAKEARMWAAPLTYGGSSFEEYYLEDTLDKFPARKLLGLPVLLKLPNGVWAGVAEAGLADFAGLYVIKEGGALRARLAPSMENSDIKVRLPAPFDSPWRLILLGRTAGSLLESNLVNNLNEPAKGNWDWVRPGQIHFPWWSDYRLNVDPEDKDPAHKPGLNTWSLKKYIDFCSRNGISAHSLDGFDQAWYGGSIAEPPPTADVTKAIPAIDLPEVLRYGKSKNVRVRLWMHQKVLAPPHDVEKIFAKFEKWGVEGIMIDFLNRDDQETVRFSTLLIQKAAAHHLTINFHGSWKPTGLSRTYPNLLSHEAVLSSEYNRFYPKGSPPDHEMIYAFVRQLAGPMDVHPGSFNPIAPEKWNIQHHALSAMGTLARQLAVYVVMESGSPMLVDSPAAYEAQPEALSFVSKVPAVWDETRVVAGEVGKFIVVARRNGGEWYLGAMTDLASRELKIPLIFLGEGKFASEVFQDAPAGGIQRIEKKLASGDQLILKLSPSGGAAVRISPR